MLQRLAAVSRVECYRCEDDLRIAQANGDDGNPDVVIVGCVSPDSSLEFVRNLFPESRVLELVPSSEPRDLAAAARDHADGYLMLPDITQSALDRTLQALMRGELPIPPPVAKYLFERVQSAEVAPPRAQPYFSPSERNVIDLLLEGLSNRQIAQKLDISLHSAKRRVSAVLHKANSPSRAHFVAHMLRDAYRE